MLLLKALALLMLNVTPSQPLFFSVERLQEVSCQVSSHRKSELVQVQYDDTLQLRLLNESMLLDLFLPFSCQVFCEKKICHTYKSTLKCISLSSRYQTKLSLTLFLQFLQRRQGQTLLKLQIVVQCYSFVTQLW